jgi:uncharacterized lipoprotein YmbA
VRRKPRAAVLAAALLAAAALPGCASKPHLAVETFAIEAPDGPIPAPAPGARVVALSSVRVSPLFLDPGLVYRVGGDRVEVDPYASLAAPPRALLKAAIRAYLLREPAVKDVVPGLAGPAGLTLEVEVDEMCGDFSRAGASASALSLTATVYAGDPAPGAAPVLRKVYGRREPLPQRTAAAVVAAWNRGLASIMKELGGDLAGRVTGGDSTLSP